MIRAVFGYPILAVALVFGVIGLTLLALAHNILGDERMKRLNLHDWDNLKGY
jgi:hypothetical protein